MYDVITFGSATQDIFLTVNPEVKKGREFSTGKGFSFSLGSKIKAEDIFFSSGGGGTNTAVTFSRQGLRTAYLGKVGDDFSGEKVLDEIKKEGVDIRYVKKIKEARTNHSVILNIPSQDRTILVYRGASECIKMRDIPKEIESKWLYIAPFSEKMNHFFSELVEFGKEKGMKIAVNPSKSLLSSFSFRETLSKIDVLFLNREEASVLTKIPFQRENDIFEVLDSITYSVVVMTKGPEGLLASNKEKVFFSKPAPSKVEDRTGAGDSFASGFLSQFIKSEGDMAKSIEMGVANSTACLSKRGAKNGLLKEGQEYKKVKVHEVKGLS